MTDHVAVITGADRRIGQAIALSLAEAGYRIVVAGRGGPDRASTTIQRIAGAGGEATNALLQGSPSIPR